MARRPPSVQQLILINGPALLDRKVAHLEVAQQAVWDVGRDLVLAGYSYASLGRLLGVSGQAARQRFGRHVDAWREMHGPDVMPWDLGEVPDFDGYDEMDDDDGWEAGEHG